MEASRSSGLKCGLERTEQRRKRALEEPYTCLHCFNFSCPTQHLLTVHQLQCLHYCINKGLPQPQLRESEHDGAGIMIEPGNDADADDAGDPGVSSPEESVVTKVLDMKPPLSSPSLKKPATVGRLPPAAPAPTAEETAAFGFTVSEKMKKITARDNEIWGKSNWTNKHFLGCPCCD